ncbi:hypothetical protein B0G75_108165 [Paraburkholderia sp. BL18I3N2]|nr:hypothetical protein [Paraburkholderia sp. BL18I3N2]PRX29672.1 hypothetical protein B0G75_108165 [Paraburkholderia sp. BL18I3N2]
MTQSKPQQVRVAQAAVRPRGFIASMLDARAIALSLLVDRALSA